MEIKLKNQAMIVDLLRRYINSIYSGDVPYPRCCLCMKEKGQILGLYYRPGVSNCTVFAICVECWIKNRSEDGEKLLKEKGELDEVLMKMIGQKIEDLLVINMPNEILKVGSEEWIN